ncbi:synaptotagmin-10 [Hydra vulgaris]|uniref:synaptotagmin-10 n=1 Tax=Hydra vulgaris TaxID=6087 RepID=UPI0002B41079|nr:synaptotagmin-10 [Hydra vulgaris]
MNVPVWLLAILVCLSLILITVCFVVGFNVTKNWLHMQKYERIRSKRCKNHAHLKATSFLCGYENTYKLNPHQNFPFLPITSTNVIQKDNSVKWLESKQSTSTTSTLHAKIPPFNKFERRLLLSHAESFDERSFQRLLHKQHVLRSSATNLRQIESPSSYRSFDGSTDSRGNSLTVKHNALVDFDTSEQTETVYLNNGYLTESDEILKNEPLISYDQDSSTVFKSIERGSLTFLLEYDSKLAELLITVKNAIDLPSVSGKDRVNSYVNICIVPEDFLWKRTEVVPNNCCPIYNTTFRITDVLYHKLREYTLCFYVMDVDVTIGETVVGKVLYPLSDLRMEQIVEVQKELSLP